MPVEHGKGGTAITGDAIMGYRAVVLISAIDLYQRTGMMATRGLTVGKMADLASEYTGKRYARSKRGLADAHHDLLALREANGASLDALGQRAKEIAAQARREAEAAIARLNVPMCRECGERPAQNNGFGGFCDACAEV